MRLVACWPLSFFQLSLQPLVFLAQSFQLLGQLFLLSLQLLFSPPQLLVFLPQPLNLATSTTPLLLKRGKLLLSSLRKKERGTEDMLRPRNDKFACLRKLLRVRLRFYVRLWDFLGVNQAQGHVFRLA